MTNFRCMFCGDKMDIPPEIKKKVSPVTHRFWHEKCVMNPKYELTDEQKQFYMSTGNVF